MASALPSVDRPATRADLEAIPPHLKGEVIHGALYTQPRPRFRHSRAGGLLFGDLLGPYDLGRGGPGGWWIVAEPGIELDDAPEVSPDIAGWRRERLPQPDPDRPIQVVPDWVCEILSPSNHGYDRTVKFPFYASIGVAWLWVVDPRARTVEVKELIDDRWTDVATHAEDDTLSAPPFQEAEIQLASLWLP